MDLHSLHGDFSKMARVELKVVRFYPIITYRSHPILTLSERQDYLQLHCRAGMGTSVMEGKSIAFSEPDPRQNHLLAALPEADLVRILPRLELVDLSLGRAVYESGRVFSNVYFPITSIVSLLYVLENGASAEISVVGNDGVVGIALFMGGESMPNRAIVQSAGKAYRLDGQTLKQEFNRSGAFQHLLMR